jgi:hypothetical protein
MIRLLSVHHKQMATRLRQIHVDAGIYGCYLCELSSGNRHHSVCNPLICAVRGGSVNISSAPPSSASALIDSIFSDVDFAFPPIDQNSIELCVCPVRTLVRLVHLIGGVPAACSPSATQLATFDAMADPRTSFAQGTRSVFHMAI